MEGVLEDVGVRGEDELKVNAFPFCFLVAMKNWADKLTESISSVSGLTNSSVVS